MNDETRRVFRRTIAARKSDEFQLVREIHKRTESDKAFKLRFNALVGMYFTSLFLTFSFSFLICSNC